MNHSIICVSTFLSITFFSFAQNVTLEIGMEWHRDSITAYDSLYTEVPYLTMTMKNRGNKETYVVNEAMASDETIIVPCFSHMAIHASDMQLNNAEIQELRLQNRDRYYRLLLSNPDTCSYVVLEEDVDENAEIELPFMNEYLRAVYQELYPNVSNSKTADSSTTFYLQKGQLVRKKISLLGLYVLGGKYTFEIPSLLYDSGTITSSVDLEENNKLIEKNQRSSNINTINQLTVDFSVTD